MEPLVNMVKELQKRNETMAIELGKAQAEMEYWKNKFLEKNERTMEYKS